jgi:peptidoglycan-N-acetylglucosamine deacetylase
MKNKNFKITIFSTIVFCGLFAASLGVIHLLLSRKQAILGNYMSIIANKNIKNSVVKKEPSVADIQNREQEVYNIVGSSNKLSKKDQVDLDNWRHEIVYLAKKNKDTVFINGFTENKTVCLTFDDGPDGTITPRVLDILKAHHIKASFFFIGENVKEYPAVVKRAYNEDNLVLNHSYTHPKFSKLSEKDIKKELSLTETAIYNLIGKRTSIIRPPYGDVTQKTINILKGENYKTVIWSIDTLDWFQKDKKNIAGNVLKNVRPGDIILMHSIEGNRATLKALPIIIQGLQKMGYKFLDISEMLHVNAYK